MRGRAWRRRPRPRCHPGWCRRRTRGARRPGRWDPRRCSPGERTDAGARPTTGGAGRSAPAGLASAVGRRAMTIDARMVRAAVRGASLARMRRTRRPGLMTVVIAATAAFSVTGCAAGMSASGSCAVTTLDLHESSVHPGGAIHVSADFIEERCEDTGGTSRAASDVTVLIIPSASGEEVLLGRPTPTGARSTVDETFDLPSDLPVGPCRRAALAQRREDRHRSARDDRHCADSLRSIGLLARSRGSSVSGSPGGRGRGRGRWVGAVGHASTRMTGIERAPWGRAATGSEARSSSSASAATMPAVAW